MSNDFGCQSNNYFQLFAYGSCMNHGSLGKTLGCRVSEYFIGPAYLEHYKLVFDYASLNELVCCANIRPQNGHVVEGALFKLPIECLESIDRREGVFIKRYKRQLVRLSLHNGKTTFGYTYIGLVTLNDEAAPSARYRELLLQGVCDSKVSYQYQVNLFEHIDSLPDRIQVN